MHKSGVVVAWREHLTRLAALLERQRSLTKELSAMMAGQGEEVVVRGEADRLGALAEMIALTDRLRRALDEEGELWLLFFKAAQSITPTLERAKIMVKCFPYFPDGPAITRERIKAYVQTGGAITPC